MEVDHVIPIHRRGAALALDNLQALVSLLSHSEDSNRERYQTSPRLGQAPGG